jgi:hypothetical protein
LLFNCCRYVASLNVVFTIWLSPVTSPYTSHPKIPSENLTRFSCSRFVRLLIR